jgi:LmeA-like phospholipid-binding
MRTRPRRGLRRLVIAIVFLACLGIIADRVAESLAEDRLAALAQDEAARYDVRASASSVEVGGYGLLPQLAKGEFSRVTLTMQRPTISSIPAQDLAVAMTGIQVPRELLTGDTGDTGAAVTVDSADLRLRLSPDALTELVARTSGLDGLTLRIVDGRLQARVVVQGVEAAATVRPQAQNGRIRLVVDDLPAPLPSAVREAVNSLLAKGIEVPDLPFGASLKQIAVDGPSVLLTATAADVELPTA